MRKAKTQYTIFRITPGISVKDDESSLDKMELLINGLKSLPYKKRPLSISFEAEKVGENLFYRILVPEEHANNVQKIFTSIFKDFKVDAQWITNDTGYFIWFPKISVFRSDSPVPLIRTMKSLEEAKERINSIMNGIDDGTLNVRIDFGRSGKPILEWSDVKGTKIDDQMVIRNVGFVKDVLVSFSYLSNKLVYQEWVIPSLLGSAFDVSGKMKHIIKRYSFGNLITNEPVDILGRINDTFYSIFYGRKMRLSKFPENDWIYLNAQELGSVFNYIDLDRVERGKFKMLSPFEAIRMQEELEKKAKKDLESGKEFFTKIAKFEYPGVNEEKSAAKESYFSLFSKFKRKHVYILWRTGTGKSTLLKVLAKDDIDNGRGFAVIDPNGDFAEEILDMIPQNRIDDVIYIDPSIYAWRVCLPIFPFLNDLMNLQRREEIRKGGLIHGSYEESGYTVVSPDIPIGMLVSIIKSVSVGWGAMWGPRMDNIMKKVAAEILDYKDAQISDISSFLNNEKMRKKVIWKIKNKDIRDSLNAIEDQDERARDEAYQPVRNRFDVFLADTLRGIFSGVPKLDIREAMDTNKIIIMRLPKGQIGDFNSAIIGAVLIGLFLSFAKSRASIPEDDRVDFTMYVDEAQNFVNDTFSEILEEARKYKLSLVMANQFGKQIKHRNVWVYDSIRGNIGTLIALGLGVDDAEEFSEYFGVSANDIAGLPSLHAYVKNADMSSTAFNIQTEFVMPGPDCPGREEVIRRSYAKYGIDTVTDSDGMRVEKPYSSVRSFFEEHDSVLPPRVEKPDEKKNRESRELEGINEEEILKTDATVIEKVEEPVVEKEIEYTRWGDIIEKQSNEISTFEWSLASGWRSEDIEEILSEVDLLDDIPDDLILGEKDNINLDLDLDIDEVSNIMIDEIDGEWLSLDILDDGVYTEYNDTQEKNIDYTVGQNFAKIEKNDIMWEESDDKKMDTTVVDINMTTMFGWDMNRLSQECGYEDWETFLCKIQNSKGKDSLSGIKATDSVNDVLRSKKIGKQIEYIPKTQ